MPFGRSVSVLRRMCSSLLVSLAITPALPAIASTPAQGVRADAAVSPSGLHPGDKLDIVVFDHPDLSGPATVTDDGTIFVALIGAVQAGSRLPQDVASDIEQRLESYISDPAVDVRVVSQSNTAYVVGVTTGTIALHASDTLAMAVSEMKSKLPDSADLTKVTIRSGNWISKTYNLLQVTTASDTTPLLVSGETINIPAKPVIISVTGALKAPATVYLGTDEPLNVALSGLQYADDANQVRVTVIRDGKSSDVIPSSPILRQPGKSGDQLIIPRVATVTVLGYVSKAGPVTLKGDQTLATALSLAGGSAKGADLGKIVVINPEATDPKSSYYTVDYNKFTLGNPSGNTELTDGELVYVPKQASRPSPQELLALALVAAKKMGIDLTKLLK